MRRSTTNPPPLIEKWAEEDVHRWLMTEVKVHETCADRFPKEEVSGDSLVDFEKTDILDLGIKHGPAVKITSYLERLKEGSQQESQFPAEVENWTKEEVTRWLVQQVKLDGKKAERFQEEEVSGDCLVCFRKQDLLDLELKKGPTVKILKELSRLKNKPEPMMSSIRHSIRLSFRARKKPESKKAPEKNQLLTSQEAAANAAVLIKNILDKLGRNDLKSFKFQLRNFKKEGYDCVPLSKLEDKDTMDIATLLTDHYGCQEALWVTRDILQKINQRELVSQLESHKGQVKYYDKCCAGEEDTEDTVKSDSPSSSTCKNNKREEKNFLCFMNVKINLPSCFNEPSL